MESGNAYFCYSRGVALGWAMCNDKLLPRDLVFKILVVAIASLLMGLWFHTFYSFHSLTTVGVWCNRSSFTTNVQTWVGTRDKPVGNWTPCLRDQDRCHDHKIFVLWKVCESFYEDFFHQCNLFEETMYECESKRGMELGDHRLVLFINIFIV